MEQTFYTGIIGAVLAATSMTGREPTEPVAMVKYQSSHQVGVYPIFNNEPRTLT